MSDTPRDAKSIFLAALDIQNPDERAAFVVRSCQGDDPLQKRVEDLLRAYGESGGPLDKMAAAIATTRLGEPIREQVGSTIGPYKLMEQIGEGGFGLVFVAEQQQPIRRKVALKIIKPGMDTRDVIARFEAERQALALMDHPNIARVLDAGTTESGRPYFVMELVRGIPITDYCDQAQLTPRERLELFVPVCNAIQHAHLKGIIHRDVKPSNVLVTLHDDRPVVKVIDFGVAKALYQSLTERTIYTRYAQMIGTPLYMSPEQAQMSGLDIDTRSDIYSLGVLLYELLTGSTPFNKERLAKAAYDELLKIIREEEPPKPSLRLSQSGDSLPSIAAQRKTEPAKLSKMFSGDLDWIAMKALEKDRTRRYETANAFAADVLRYLNDEPVEASPPSTPYRIRKFARKHRGPVIALVTIAAMLMLGIAGTTWGLFRARRAEQSADESKEEAIDALNQVSNERDEKERARRAEALERARAERQFATGLLRPVGGGLPREIPTDVELRSFVEWAAIKESPVKLLVLEIALDDPDIAMKLATQAERAIQSCVGLSPKRRARAIELVSVRQRDAKADPRIRAAACWLALELGSNDLPAWSEICNFTSGLGSKPGVFDAFIDFALTRSDPQQVAALSVGPLLSILERAGGENAVIRQHLPLIGPRLRENEPKRCLDALMATVDRLTRKVSGAFGDLEVAYDATNPPRFVAIAPRLRPIEAARAADVLSAFLERTSASPGSQLYGIVMCGLADLVPRVGEDALGGIASAQIAKLKNSSEFVKGTGTSQLNVMLWSALAPRMQASDVKRASDDLLEILAKSSNGSIPLGVPEALSALAPRMENSQTTSAANSLIAILNRPPHWENLVWIESALKTFAPRFDPKQVSRITESLLVFLRKWMDNPDPDYASHIGFVAPPSWRDPPAFLAGSLVSLAPGLEPSMAKHVWDALAELDEKSRDDNLVACLTAVALRLNPQEVDKAANNFIGFLDKSTPHAARCLRSLSGRLSEQRISQVVDGLISTSEQEPSVSASGLAALAGRMSRAQAARAWDALFPKITKTPFLFPGANELVSLAPWIDSARLGRGADSLITLSNHIKGQLDPNYARRDLIAIAPWLESGPAKRVWDNLMAAREEWPELVNDGTAALAPKLGEAVRDQLAMQAAQYFFDYIALVNPGADADTLVPGKPVRLVRSISSPRSLARLLSHPASVGLNREFLLERFEEVVFHDGRHVFLHSDSAKEVTNSQKAQSPPRRFHNVHDAAKWIQENWPDFDLDSNCPVAWRGSL